MVIFAEERGCTTLFELGELFSKEARVPGDFEQAFKWYKRAAKKGSRRAQHRLAAMYARGQGITQDYAKAYAWCMIANLQNSKRAKRKLKYIEARMRLEQVEWGKRLASDYFEKFTTHENDA
ncbi:MAG TPA: tetratricopeptide repeat protein [Gammaproteobacteria bacterium]|nr:tetratricopeptide repeat protein [Gammaproteobacteria bacterium]